MKKSVLKHVGLVALVAFGVSQVVLEREVGGENPPRPIEIDEGEDHEGREAYMKLLLGGDDERDWKTAYEKVRLNAGLERMSNRRRSMRAGELPTSEIVSTGVLEGKWIERGAKNQAGRVLVTTVIESQDKVVLATDGGSILIGPLSGNDYTILNDQMRLIAEGVHAFDLGNGGFRVVVLTESGIFYSDNGDGVWNQVLSDSMVSSTLSRSDNAIYAVSYYGSLYKSTDQGASFSSLGSVTNNYGDYQLFTPRFADGDVYLVSGSTVHKSTGTTFTQVGSLPAAASPVTLSGDVTSATPSLWASAGKSVYKSTNSGVTWTYMGAMTESPWGPNSYCAINDTVQYFGNVELYRSNNSSNWTMTNGWVDYYETYGGDSKTNLHADIHEIRPYQDSQGSNFALISCDGGTFVTSDYSNYLNITQTGIRNNMYYGSQTRWEEPDYIIAGSQDQGTQISQPGNGDTILDFYQYISGDEGSYTSSDSGKSTWFTYSYGVVYYHPDTKIASAKRAGKPSESDSYLWMAPTVADPADPQTVYTGGNYLWKTTYNGTFVSVKHSTMNFGNVITAIAISPIDTNHWYITTKNKEFYHSSDRGITWTLMSSSMPSNHWLIGQSIEPDPTTLGRVFVSGNGNGNSAVYVSDSHGTGFVSVGSDVPTTTVTDMTFDDSGEFLYAAAYDAAYVYIAAENRWYNITGSTGPDVQYFTVEYVPTIQTARFATHGRGIFDFKVTTGTVSEPTLSLTSPNGGETVSVNSDLTIDWSDNLENEITVNLLKDGQFLQTLGTVAADLQTLTWTVPDDFDNSGAFSVEIVSTIDGLADTSDASFTISGHILEMTAPDSGSLYFYGDTIVTVWNSSFSDTILLSLLNMDTLVRNIGSVISDSGSFSWIVPDSFGSYSQLKIALSCESRNLHDSTNGTFAISDLQRLTQDHFSVLSVSSNWSADYDSSKILDGNDSTFWHMADGELLPQEIVFQLDSLYSLTAFSVLPRQDESQNGRIENFTFEVSADGVTWTEIVAGSWDSTTSEKLEVFSDSTDEVQFVKFTAVSSTAGSDKASIADFTLFYTDVLQEVGVAKADMVIDALELRGIQNNRLNLAIPKQGTYSVELFAMNGRRVYHNSLTLKPGMHAVPLSDYQFGNQIVLMQIQGGGSVLKQKIRLQ